MAPGACYLVSAAEHQVLDINIVPTHTRALIIKLEWGEDIQERNRKDR